MSEYSIRPDHVRLIAREQVRHSLRGGAGVVFLVMALLVGLLCAGIYTSFVETIMTSAEFVELRDADPSAGKLADKFVEEFGNKVVAWMVRGEPRADQLQAFLVQKPAVVSVFMLTFFLLLPLLVVLSSFNQMAGEIGNRGLRYILLRTERVNLFLGRFVGTYLFTAIVLAGVMAIVWLYLILNFEIYSRGEVTAWMARGTLVTVLFALPHVAICSWVSTLFGSRFGALAMCYGMIAGIPIVVAVLASKMDALDYAWFAVPWGHKYAMLDPSWGHALLSMAAMIGFTALFVFLGARFFQRRDV